MLKTNNGSIDHGSRRHQMAMRILEGVFHGDFVPAQRLKVEQLSDLYGVSATPIREALVELAGIGMVQLQPNRGALLCPFGPKQLRDICQIRRILECEATRCACGRIAPVELEVLEQSFLQLIDAQRGPQWSEQTRQLDSKLHELITSRCGNERLIYEIERYGFLFRILRDVRHERRQMRDNYQQMEENAEHLAVVQALAAGQAEQAVEAMSKHIQTSARLLELDMFSGDEIASSKNEPAILQTI